MTTRSIGLPDLLDDDLVEAVAAEDADQDVACLLDPLRDVRPASLVGRVDGEDVADIGLPDAPDELHQRTRAEAASGVDDDGGSGRGQLGHGIGPFGTGI